MTSISSTSSNIKSLWVNLSSLYGRAFTQQFGIDVDKSGVWTKTLSLLSQQDIEYGFNKLMLTDKHITFPPNPIQFKEICLSRRPELKLPSLNEAYSAAKLYFSNGITPTRHKAVLFCALKVGEDLLTGDDENLAYTKFKSLYERASIAVAQGLSLPQLPKEEKKELSINTDVAINNLSKIKLILNKRTA